MNQKITRCALLSALAILIGFLESQIPVPIPVPGVKLGLSNVVVLLALFYLSKKQAFCILIIKIGAAGLLFSGVSGFLYSLSGGLVAFMAMALGQRIKSVSVVGVSVLGAVFHNVGQILMAALILKSGGLIYYLGILILAGTFVGTITGIISYIILNRLKFFQKPLDKEGEEW